MTRRELERRLEAIFADDTGAKQSAKPVPRLEKLVKGLFADVIVPEPTPPPALARPAPPKLLTRPAKIDPLLESRSVSVLPAQIRSSDLPQETYLEAKGIQPIPEPPFTALAPARRGVRLFWRVILWTGLSIATVLLLLLAYGSSNFSVWFNWSSATENQPNIAPQLTSTPSPTAAASPTANLMDGTNLFSLAKATPVPLPLPGGRNLVLRPAAQDAGWLMSDDEETDPAYGPFNHFGEPFLYAGVLDGKVYYAAIQFDLSMIPRGANIRGASLRLTGLRDNLLDRERGGSWQLQLLPSELDYNWQTHTYQQIHQAASSSSFGMLGQAELAKGRINEFEFTPEQLSLLERRILQGSEQFGAKVSFRLVGPMAGEDNLFAWAGGSGTEGDGTAPELFLNVGPPPEKTPLPFYVVVTSTPTPENVMTAVMNSHWLTAEAIRIGTVTPLPPHWVTPVVVTATPTPANPATAEMMRRQATAIALTTGEPPNVVTATATPTYVIITSTPTPESVMTAVAEALQFGQISALPANWVTPFVVTATPSPANQTTVEYQRAIMLTTGTPTPLPANVQTATPTPVAIAVQPLASPTATATPSPTPQPIPADLLGKIVFLSDREGATDEERLRAGQLKVTPEAVPQPYVFDPQTGQLSRLTDRWPYDVAAARDSWSSDTAFEAYAQQLLWTNVEQGGRLVPTEVIAIHFYDYIYKVERIVTQMGAGMAYDPAWSPVSDEIVFVSTESGNDEIWVTKRDGTDVRQLTHNAWEWDKYPSWSPDGQQIIFYSNRTGNRQIWIMNKDGSEQRLLMEPNPYNDWDPVWIKYPDPVPALLREQDWRFQKQPDEAQGNR